MFYIRPEMERIKKNMEVKENETEKKV